VRVGIVSHGVMDESLLGGPGRVASRHAVALAAQGHEVRVVTTDLVRKGLRTHTPHFSFAADTQGVRITSLPAYSLRRWPGAVGPLYVPGLRSVLKEMVNWADVVHAHEWPTALTQVARREAGKSGTPCFIQPHGTIATRGGWKGAAHRTYNRLHRPNGDELFIVFSAPEAKEVRDAFGTDIAVQELGNPTPACLLTEDAPEVSRRRVGWGFPEASTIALYAHRIAPNKGLDLLIEAFAQLPKDYCLAILGEDATFPAFSSHCRALIERLDLHTRIAFGGPFASAEADEVILAADLFILPARFDIFPLMVLNALACGRPVVMTRTCQAIDSLGEATVIADPEPESLAKAISSLSPIQRRQLSSAGRALVEARFSNEAIGARLEQYYVSKLTAH